MVHGGGLGSAWGFNGISATGHNKMTEKHQTGMDYGNGNLDVPGIAVCEGKEGGEMEEARDRGSCDFHTQNFQGPLMIGLRSRRIIFNFI